MPDSNRSPLHQLVYPHTGWSIKGADTARQSRNGKFRIQNSRP